VEKLSELTASGEALTALMLTQALIRCPSVTPNDAGCQDLVAAQLVPLGFAIHDLQFEETRNLWASHGQGAPVFAFVGHTDVVPTGPLAQWHSDPFVPTIRDGMLFGRGAADMKAGVAAATCALRDFVAAQPNHPGTVAILLTSDEEGPAQNGVVKVMDWLAARDIKLDYALIGEPSSSTELGDQIRVGRRGSMHVEVVVHGVQGHVAYPEKARNPIHLAGKLLTALAAHAFDQGNAAFPPTSMQIYEIAAGAGANNIIPGELKFKLNFRFGTASTAETLLAQVHTIAAELSVPIGTTHRIASQPFLTTRITLIDAVRRAAREILSIDARPDTGGGTSDGRFIAPFGAEIVELGPVNATIHKIDECLAVADIERLKKTYQAVLEGVCLAEGRN
jgi:succinyl-diaminopimelate desuccinylase